MAALTAIAVSARTPKTVTLTLNASAFDLNASQVAQLNQVVTKLSIEVGSIMPGDTPATITGI